MSIENVAPVGRPWRAPKPELVTSRDGEMLAAKFRAMQRGEEDVKPMQREQADVISSDEILVEEDLTQGNLMEDLREDFRVSRENRKPVRPPGKRRRSRGFARFLLAICLGIAVTLAWQSYGDASKQIIATTAPELGWSPEAKQMIASSIQWLGWTKTSPPTTAVQNVAPTSPTAASLDSAQMQQMVQTLAALREMIQQLTANQEQTTREIAKLQSAVMLTKLPESAPQTAAAPARKPAPTAMPSSRVPTAQSSSRPQ